MPGFPIGMMRRATVGLVLAGVPGLGTQAGAQPAHATRVTAQPTTFHNTLWRGHAVFQRIRPGDTVRTRTLDADGLNAAGQLEAKPFNPATGPFFVEGAEPGDAIIVHLTRLRLSRGWGYTLYRLGLFALDESTVEGLYPNRYKQDLVFPGQADVLPWDIDTLRGVVRLREPRSERFRFEFPVRPMLGVVGVAPAGDFAPTTLTSAEHGGNLDFNEIQQGSTVWLPVFHPGALLFIGDGHALQGDGEPISTGIETSMEVEFVVQLRKGARIAGPRVETPDYIISVGSQPEFVSSLDRGLRLATTDMVRWLIDDYAAEPWAAHLLVGYQGEYEIITAAGSVGLKIPKGALPGRRQ